MLISLSAESTARQTGKLLKQLESDLMAANLWAEVAPSAEALASIAPFACDTMPLEHWLQFIFIPKMTELMTTGRPLPSNIAILPMAQEMFTQLNSDSMVLKSIGQLDALLGAQTVISGSGKVE